MRKGTELKRAGITVVRELSILEVNKIASLISEKICGSFPEHNIRYIAINEDYDSFKKNNDAKEMMVGIKGIINDRYIKEDLSRCKM